MERIVFGRTNLKIAPIGFGAWGISGRDWGKTDDSQSKKAIHKAIDAGINFFDTADNYGWGHSENLIAEVLKERQDKHDIIIATKAGNNFYPYLDQKHNISPGNPDFSKKHLIFAVEQSLKRLNRDRIDILQLHSPSLSMVENEEAFEALEILKTQGKIKHAGWSIVSFAETEQSDMVEKYNELIDVIQVRYNLLERQAEDKILPVALKYNIGVIARIPLLFGFLSGKFTRKSKFGSDDHRSMNLSAEKLDSYLKQMELMEPFFSKNAQYTKAQLSLKFCISHPAVHVAIPGCKTEQQVMENIGAAYIPDSVNFNAF